jgi:hypothetical protein
MSTSFTLGKYFPRRGIGVVDSYRRDAMKTLRDLSARLFCGNTAHGNDFRGGHVAVTAFPVNDGRKRRPGERAIEVAKKGTDEQRAQRASDNRP